MTPIINGTTGHVPTNIVKSHALVFDSVCYNDAYNDISFHNTDEKERGHYAPSPHLYRVAPSHYKFDRGRRELRSLMSIQSVLVWHVTHKAIQPYTSMLPAHRIEYHMNTLLKSFLKCSQNSSPNIRPCAEHIHEFGVTTD